MNRVAFLFACIFFCSSGIYAQRDRSVIIQSEPVALNYIDIFGETKRTDDPGELPGQNAMMKAELNEPRFLYFLDTKSPQFTFYYFFAFPGDSILIHRANSAFSIRSKNYPSVNYLIESFEKDSVSIFLANESRKLSLVNSFTDAYKVSKRTFLHRDSLIDHYSGELGENYNKLKKLNRIVRLDYLLQPYNPCSSRPDFTPETGSGEYFAEIGSLFSLAFENEDDISLFSFWLSKIATNYLNYMVKDTPAEEKTKTKIDLISRMPEGNTRTIFITKLFLEEGTNSSFYDEYYPIFSKICKNEAYRALLEARKLKVKEITTSETIASTLLESPRGDVISWDSLTGKHPGKMVYVDIWASWCSGCKIALPKLNKYAKENPDLKVVFLSKDHDIKKWEKSLSEWDFPDNAEHYRIDPDTELSKAISEPSIPRFLLINRSGEVTFISAESIGTPNFEKMMRRLGN